MALVIASNTYEVTKSMIENEEVVEGEDLSTKQIINRIFRWYVTEEKVKAISASTSGNYSRIGVTIPANQSVIITVE